MGLDRSIVERQLEHAQAALDQWVKALDAQGVSKGQRKRDAKWRSLNAKCTQLEGRLRSIAAVEARDAEVLERKAAAAAGASTEE